MVKNVVNSHFSFGSFFYLTRKLSGYEVRQFLKARKVSVIRPQNNKINLKMNIRIKYWTLIFVVFLYSCHYHHDDLKVENCTINTIGYTTLAKNIEGKYYEVSAGGEIDGNNSDSPLTRGSIEYDVFKEKNDGYLYIVFYDLKFKDYVYENTNKIVTDNRFIVKKYSKTELIKSNWIVKYNGN